MLFRSRTCRPCAKNIEQEARHLRKQFQTYLIPRIHNQQQKERLADLTEAEREEIRSTGPLIAGAASKFLDLALSDLEKGNVTDFITRLRKVETICATIRKIF